MTTFLEKSQIWGTFGLKQMLDGNALNLDIGRYNVRCSEGVGMASQSSRISSLAEPGSLVFPYQVSKAFVLTEVDLCGRMNSHQAV